jgi:hypothetical protein
MQAMAAFDKGVLRFMMGKRLEAALKLNTVFIYRVDPVSAPHIAAVEVSLPRSVRAPRTTG